IDADDGFENRRKLDGRLTCAAAYVQDVELSLVADQIAHRSKRQRWRAIAQRIEMLVENLRVIVEELAEIPGRRGRLGPTGAHRQIESHSVAARKFCDRFFQKLNGLRFVAALVQVGGKVQSTLHAIRVKFHRFAISVSGGVSLA